MSEITKLEPKLVWELFDAITRVPRPSKKEEKIREFLVDFAKKHNIDYQTDQTGNVVMRVPGTKGYENRPCVILQSHMDMVCEKNSDTAFDFDKDPIRTKIVDGWVKAEGTTLGADDGIGMAAALAALLDPALEHGPLEALFTVDEETGLTGAFGLGKGMLTGRYLVNLDSEDEGEIFIGCAGGVDTLATFRYKTEAAPEGHAFFRVRVSDLSGGHSGDDIDKGRMNSNKLVARLLWNGAQRFGLRLSRFDGGNLRNAIPREAYAVFAVPSGSKAGFEAFYKEFAGELAAEAKFREPNFKIGIEEVPAASVIDAANPAQLALRARRTAQRSDRDVAGHAGTCRNIDQPRFGEIRRGRPDRRDHFTALLGGECQGLCVADDRIGVRFGGCRGVAFGGVSRLGAQSPVQTVGNHGCQL